MKLVTIRTPQGERAGRLDGNDVVLLPFANVTDLLASGDGWEVRATGGPERVPLATANLAPVVRPSKVFCVGLNYLLHIKEGGREVPEYPTLFAKFPEALTGPNDDIVLRPTSPQVDWEAELVVVIGKNIRDADEDQAIGAIAGFTVGNDVSMRDWQRRTTQFLAGKTWEASSPIGPALVTTDELGSARPNLAISCLLDDVVMQDARTSDLLFDPVHIVCYASTIMTLHPGDALFTGTPDGVGFARTPPVFLLPGQTMTTRIEKLGELRNRMVAL